MSTKPNFFIVGAPKSGTTAMGRYLAAHPQVFMARKEMHTFGADLRFGSQFYRRTIREYLAEFEDWDGQPRAGEASVWYLYSTAAACELNAFSPGARIIIMLRDPAEMAYSLYNQFVFDGNEYLPSFEAALAAEPDRLAGKRIGRSAYFHQGLAYRQVVRYAAQVQRYYEAFGTERVLVVLYDDFKSDTAGAYRRALKFLEVDPQPLDTLFNVINPSKSARSRALRAVLADPWLRGAALAVRPWLPRAFFAMLQRLDARLREINTRVQSRPPLTAEVAAELRSEFAVEVECLGRLIGRDLSRWSRIRPPVAGHASIPIWLPHDCGTPTSLVNGR